MREKIILILIFLQLTGCIQYTIQQPGSGKTTTYSHVILPLPGNIHIGDSIVSDSRDELDKRKDSAYNSQRYKNVQLHHDASPLEYAMADVDRNMPAPKATFKEVGRDLLRFQTSLRKAKELQKPIPVPSDLLSQLDSETLSSIVRGTCEFEYKDFARTQICNSVEVKLMSSNQETIISATDMYGKFAFYVPDASAEYTIQFGHYGEVMLHAGEEKIIRFFHP